MARPAGLEPATSEIEVPWPIQLAYGRAKVVPRRGFEPRFPEPKSGDLPLVEREKMQPNAAIGIAFSRHHHGRCKHRGVVGKAVNVALMLVFKFSKDATGNVPRAIVAGLMPVVASPDGASQSCTPTSTTTERPQC